MERGHFCGGYWWSLGCQCSCSKGPPPFEKAPRVQPELGYLERISAHISSLSFEGSLRASWAELLVAPSLLPRFLVPWLSIISETGVLWLWEAEGMIRHMVWVAVLV